MPPTGEWCARDIRTVRQPLGQSHSVHLRVRQHASAADHRRPRDGLEQTALRDGHVSGAWAPRTGVQGPDKFPELDENRDRVRRRRR